MIYAVYVEDRLLDIDPSQVIALTLQASDIGSGDIVNRKASFTNQITVPRTNNNISVLGYSNILNAITTFPFIKKNVRVTANGITLLQGIVMIKSFDGGFNLQIYSMPKDLSLLIANKNLDDLDFGDSPITWDATYWDTRRASTTGLCAPVINYGQINPALANGTIGDYYLPSVSYKDILTQILTEAGFTVSGTFYSSDTIFSRIVMTYGRKLWPGTSFKINEILPDDISQTDFVSDFLIRFGAFFRIVGSDVEILTLEGILGNTANAVDWTSKRANKKQTIEYDWGIFAQKNWFRYPKIDFFEPSINRYDDASGSLDVSNENITPSKDLYTSLFAKDEVVPTGGGIGSIDYNIATVQNAIIGATQPVWETLPSSYEFDNDPKPMLCLLRDPTTWTVGGVPFTESTILYNGNVRGDYKIAMFSTPTSFSYIGYTPHTDNMRWRNNFDSTNGLLDLYYPTLEMILADGSKKVTREYVLNDLDIYSLDLLTPIFDTDDYFLISKVKDYVSGRVTEVELLRIAYQS